MLNRDDGEFFTSWSRGRYTVFRMHNNTWKLSCIISSEEYDVLQYMYDTTQEIGKRIIQADDQGRRRQQARTQ